MRLSQVLNRQNIGFMFKKHWIIQGKRVPLETGAEEHLKSLNIPVEDANEFIKEEPEKRERIKVVGLYDLPLPLNENHPDYKERPCYTLLNTNVLVEAVSQAQVLTKTVISEGTLPPRVEELSGIEVPTTIHECVKKAILSANVFDSEQRKLPKIKDPERPAVNFPRILGITDRRRNAIITNKLLQLIEKSSDTESTLSKYVANDVESKFTYEKDDDLIQFQEVSHILVTSDQPLKYELPKKTEGYTEVPDLYPVKHTISLTKEHFYEPESSYPIRQSVSRSHPHTTWLHMNRTEVSNLYEEPVTDAQVLSRSIVHSFTVAAAYAKQLYGEDTTQLPEPVYLNCIQTDGQKYHLGVLELNTLDLNGTDGAKNVWYCKNDLKLYDSSRYLSGIPVLENYNPQVYGYINALYNS